MTGVGFLHLKHDTETISTLHFCVNHKWLYMSCTRVEKFSNKGFWKEKGISEVIYSIIIIFFISCVEYFVIKGLPLFFLYTSSGPCDAGYICFYNATRPTPTFELGVLEWGRLCSAGFYCPSGTTHERACPEGTYRSVSLVSMLCIIS